MPTEITELNESDYKSLRTLAREVYEKIGYDAFGGDCTDEDLFVDVMRDHVLFALEGGDCDIVDHERLAKMWPWLEYNLKRKLLLEVM